MTVYDAQATPTTQVTQMQDVLSAGKFTGVLLQPIYPAAELSEVKALIAAKMPVVNIDQILGTNYKDTGIQVKGLDGNVVFAPAAIGRQLGFYTNKACNHRKSCKIALIHNYIGYEPDVQITKSFKAELSTDTADKVIAEADGAYSPATATTKVQDILSANPGVNVIAGSDQDCEGAQTALKLDNVKGVKLVCYGASQASVAGIKSGLWTADVAQLPATEGKLGMQMLVRAIRSGKSQGSLNPVAKLPNDGVVLPSNVAHFKPEWKG
jgi:ribose transport system substrate-binding protein